jgi:hypothetical protein
MTKTTLKFLTNCAINHKSNPYILDSNLHSGQVLRIFCLIIIVIYYRLRINWESLD